MLRNKQYEQEFGHNLQYWAPLNHCPFNAGCLCRQFQGFIHVQCRKSVPHVEIFF